jgi:amino-acid N-acetyltransferase
MPPTIAPATPGDLPQILELLERCRLPTAGLAEHLDTTLVARDGDRVVGSAALELYGAAALLRSVAVAPALRPRRAALGGVYQRLPHERAGDGMHVIRRSDATPNDRTT